MTQVSISSAFDSPQVLQECLSYLRQTAQDQVADNNYQAHQSMQCRAGKSSTSVHDSKADAGMPGAGFLSGMYSGHHACRGLPPSEPLYLRHCGAIYNCVCS
jgi:hypothetical protein